jgi:hypothetical protein
MLHTKRAGLPDFEVRVTFLTPEEGGRKTLPYPNGYRPDMGFADKPYVCMIHPEFIREDGSPFPDNTPVPQTVAANMYILFPSTLYQVRDNIYIGQSVRMVEGARTVAIGEVTAIKNLFQALSKDAEAATPFYLQAWDYVQWCNDVADGEMTVIDIRKLHGILGHLQAAAADLPSVSPEDESIPASRRERARALTVEIARKLPLDAYRAVFDPLEAESTEPVTALLADDLADVYGDVSEGCDLYDRGNYRDAIWHWRFSYYSHWGRHLTHAQTAIWQYLASGGAI